MQVNVADKKKDNAAAKTLNNQGSNKEKEDETEKEKEKAAAAAPRKKSGRRDS